MKVSTRCRYATIALFDMAYHSAESGTQVRQIAERQEIPMRFLEQIFQDLRRAKLVSGKRGRNGGYVLAQETKEISLLDIILATDGPFGFGHIETEGSESGEQTDIPALFWREIADDLSVLFKGYTLKDMVDRATELGVPRGAPGYMYFI